MWLWSGHDVFLQHYRRYTSERIRRVLRAGGLSGSYFYAALLPIVVISRMAGRLEGQSHGTTRSQMREFGPLLNSMFWLACRAELPLLRVNRLAGLSVFIRAVK
jgi:hypothetical protein